MPIPCVDAIIVHKGKFLLGQRINKPLRDEWCFVGGRVRKGELLKDAVHRHVQAETGIGQMKIKKLLTTSETIFPDSAQGPTSHTINFDFLVEIPSAVLSLSNGENNELKWFSRINPRWHPYVKKMLRLAGFGK